jgi:hypothetical protein
VCHYWHRLPIRALGSDQLTAALWTLSLNHKPRKRSVSARAGKLVDWVDRASFLNREPGGIAIAIPFQTSHVIPFVLSVRQRLGFSGTQFGIVTSLLPVLASREVTLVF